MSTLDLPQFLYACRICHGWASTGICPDHPTAGVSIEPTLTYADFQTYMAAVSLARHPMPSDEDVWDRLERSVDRARTNREAIGNAIREVAQRAGEGKA